MRLKVKRRLRAFLKTGGLVAYATESCFGLGCDPSNRQALKALIRLKRRDSSKGMIVIGADLRQLQPYCASPSIEDLARLRTSWPAAHTWLVNANANCHDLLTGGRAKLAIRVPDHAGARALCLQSGMAVVSTSANISGKKSIKNYRTALRQFGGRVLVFKGRVGHYRNPSTIQDLSTGAILRK